MNKKDISSFLCNGTKEDCLSLINSLTSNCYDFDSDALEIYDLAINYGKLDVIKYYISCGKSIDWENNDGITPLIKFSASGNITGVQFCLENNAKIHLINRKGKTAFYYAATNGELKIMKSLKLYGAKPCGLPDAIFHEKYSVLKLFIEWGADLNEVNEKGFSALWNCLSNGGKRGRKAAMELLDCGVDVNTTTPNGVHISLSAFDLDAELFQRLIDAGMRIDVPNRSGELLIDVVRQQKNYEVLAILEKL